MSYNANYMNVTGGVATNQTVTFGEGFDALTLINLGNVAATIQFSDGGSVELEGGNTVFSITSDGRGFNQVAVVCTGTSVRYVVTGLARKSIVLT